MRADCGIIGLGAMGSAIAAKLLGESLTVAGADTNPVALERFAKAGGQPCASAGEVATAAPVVLLLLPSRDALISVTEDITRNGQPGCILAECSTLSIADKEAARQMLAGRDMTLLDCPVSGTFTHAASGSLVVMASGDTAAIDRCRPVFAPLARATYDVGPFGNGMKMKFIANLLVAIHNVSTAEALAMAERAGLDLALVQQVVADGAGSSRIFEIRGPMMVEDRYEPATITIDLWRKDLDLIAGFAAAHGCETPLFSITDDLYRRAENIGLGRLDTAAVKKVFDLPEP